MVGQQQGLPRWRGFNLLTLFVLHKQETVLAPNFLADTEADIQRIADWGFNFIRIPMNYQNWLVDGNPRQISDDALKVVDRIVELGTDAGMHVSLNFHTAPGYCINPAWPVLPNLWKNADSLEVFKMHWSHLAERYKGINGDQLSFDLVNEPPDIDPEVMTVEDYVHVTTAGTEAIRAIDPDRMIVSDGYNVGTKPCADLVPLGIVQSCRGYQPICISHYKAPWASGAMDCPYPTWPQKTEGTVTEPWDRSDIEAYYDEWIEVAGSVGVHCGECGCYNLTPHNVFLDWFGDVLDVLTERNIGWGLWNLRGDFGVLDSGRDDVEYENLDGHKLDRQLLSLLQAH